MSHVLNSSKQFVERSQSSRGYHTLTSFRFYIRSRTKRCSTWPWSLLMAMTLLTSSLEFVVSLSYGCACLVFCVYRYASQSLAIFLILTHLPQPQRGFSEEVCQRLFFQLSCAVAYCHSHHVYSPLPPSLSSLLTLSPNLL